MPHDKSEWRIECKNHTGGVILEFESLNQDGTVFDQHKFESSHDRHVHLPSPTCNFQVNVLSDVLFTNPAWTGQVSDGEHLIATGSIATLQFKITHQPTGASASGASQ